MMAEVHAGPCLSRLQILLGCVGRVRHLDSGALPPAWFQKYAASRGVIPDKFAKAEAFPS